MKKFLVVIIAAGLIGKVFASIVMHLAPNTGHHFGHSFFLDKDDTQMQMGVIPDAPSEPLPAPKYVMPYRPIVIPHPVVKKVAAVDPKAKKAEEAKKARKKRKDKLEEEQAKVPAAKPAPAYYANVPGPAAPYLAGGSAVPVTSKGGGYVPPGFTAAGGNGLITTQPTTTTTAPKAPISITGNVNAYSANLAAITQTLVSNPSTAQMQTVVQMFNSKEITSTQFYGVLGSMVKSTNVESRTLAVQTASGIENANSFKILADESYTDADATVKQLASTGVSAYGQVTELSVLQSALGNGDVYDQYWAADLVKSAATSFSQTSGATAAQASQYFTNFVSPLTTLAQSTANPTLQQKAAAALQTVDQVLNGTTVASTTTSTGQ